MNVNQRVPGWVHLVVGLVVGCLLTLTYGNVTAYRADAAPVETVTPVNQWQQPYGGCKEAWQAPRSRGARECRAHGWIVRPRIVVGPANRVRYSRLPSCAVEDASSGPIPCSWNVRSTDGNGRGMAYWVTGTNERPRFHYVLVVLR